MLLLVALSVLHLDVAGARIALWHYQPAQKVEGPPVLLLGELGFSRRFWDPGTKTFEPEASMIPFPAVELIALAEKVVALHDNKPQDIEWATVNGTVYLLQARPITTLG